MLCKVILRAVSNSEESHEVLLNGGSTINVHPRPLPAEQIQSKAVCSRAINQLMHFSCDSRSTAAVILRAQTLFYFEIMSSENRPWNCCRYGRYFGYTHQLADQESHVSPKKYHSRNFLAICRVFL